MLPGAAALLPPSRPNQPYNEVSAFLAGSFRLPLFIFIAGCPPTDVIPKCPSLGFFLRHSEGRDTIVYDLGIRRDVESYPPATRKIIREHFRTDVPQTADEALRKGGVNSEDVKTIIISHLHWDHVGDPTPFTNAIFILGGESEDILRNAYPINSDSHIDRNSVPADRTRFLFADLFTTPIGPFPRAYDYYGDGSLYIIEATGHLPGHINILARTDVYGSWIYLAGDTCHDLRLLLGEKDIAVLPQSDGHVVCAHEDLEQAKEHIGRLRVLYEDPQVEVILAHDWKWYEASTSDVFFPGIILPKRSSIDSSRE